MLIPADNDLCLGSHCTLEELVVIRIVGHNMERRPVGDVYGQFPDVVKREVDLSWAQVVATASTRVVEDPAIFLQDWLGDDDLEGACVPCLSDTARIPHRVNEATDDDIGVQDDPHSLFLGTGRPLGLQGKPHRLVLRGNTRAFGCEPHGFEESLSATLPLAIEIHRDDGCYRLTISLDDELPSLSLDLAEDLAKVAAGFRRPYDSFHETLFSSTKLIV